MDEEQNQQSSTPRLEVRQLGEPKTAGVAGRIDLLVLAAGSREIGIWHLPGNREKPWLVQIQTDGDYFFEQDPIADGLGATLEIAIDDCLRRLERVEMMGRDPATAPS